MFIYPDFIVLGDLTFWLVLSGFCLLEVVWTSYRKFGWATFMLFVYATLMYFLLGNTVRTFFMDHWRMALVGFGLYFVGGFAWAVCKWFLFSAKRARVLSDTKTYFYKSHEIPESVAIKDLDKKEWMPEEKRKNSNMGLSSFVEVLQHDERWGYDRNSDGSYYKASSLIPNVSSNKARIMGWMTWWVFDVVGTILNDFIHDLFDAIYQRSKAALQWISDHNFKLPVMEFVIF